MLWHLIIYTKIIIVIRMISIKVILRASQDHMSNVSKSCYRRALLVHKYCPKYFLWLYPEVYFFKEKFLSLKRNCTKKPIVSIHYMKQWPYCAIVLHLSILIKMWNNFLFSQYTYRENCCFVPYYRRQTKEKDVKWFITNHNVLAANPE